MEKIAKAPYLIAIFIMLTNASCKRNTGTECLRKAEVVMVNGESGYSSSELTDSISFLMLEEDANSSFTSVSKLRIADDRIILFDKMGRNEIATSNEMRAIMGWQPSDDPKANELRNSNISQAKQEASTPPQNLEKEENQNGE